jgi:hypothetical protein
MRSRMFCTSAFQASVWYALELSAASMQAIDWDTLSTNDFCQRLYFFLPDIDACMVDWNRSLRAYTTSKRLSRYLSTRNLRGMWRRRFFRLVDMVVMRSGLRKSTWSSWHRFRVVYCNLQRRLYRYNFHGSRSNDTPETTTHFLNCEWILHGHRIPYALSLLRWHTWRGLIASSGLRWVFVSVQLRHSS